MKKLEEFVIEKLKVSKGSSIILDTDIYDLTSPDEFNTYLIKVDEWLHSFATKVPKDKANKPILNSDDLYISIHTKYQNCMLISVGDKNNETVLFIPGGADEVIKSDFKGNTGWRVYDTVFIVPDELKDNVIKIIDYKR